MSTMHLEVSCKQTDQQTTFVSSLRREGTRDVIRVVHELDRTTSMDDETPVDGHVLAVLLYAASTCEKLAVHGPVTQESLRNMFELLRVWSRWKPKRYRMIDITPEKIIARSRTGNRAIGSFSGGVDGTFSTLFHTSGRAPEAHLLKLTSVLLVHGFDIDFYNAADFSSLVKRVSPFLRSRNLELRTIRTNSRDLRLQDWDDSSGLELAACLHMCADDHEIGLIASGAPYDSLHFPWGSGPVTDHLMSGDHFAVRHDGAGFSRIEKIEEILRDPYACRMLRVCWSSPDQSQNCGICEKCIRTQLGFLAAGAKEPPPCFPAPLDLERIKTMPIWNHIQRNELGRVLQGAEERNITEPWVEMLRARVTQWTAPPARVTEKIKRGGPIKKAAIRLAAAAQIDQKLKQIYRPIRRGLLKALQRGAHSGRRAP